MTDLAVITVDAPESVSQGAVIDVLVTVQNVGNQDVTGDVNVTLADGDLNIGIQTISGGLDAVNPHPLPSPGIPRRNDR